MAAEFPAAIFTAMTRGALMSDATTQGAFVDKLQDELRAALQTLGVNPQGSLATVAARLANTDRVSWAGTASTVIGSTATVTITPNVENEDNGGFWTSGTSFTVPAGKGGRYLLQLWSNAGAPLSAPGALFVVVNGTSRGVQQIPTATGNATLMINPTLNASDVVTFQIQNGHSSSLTFTSEINITRVCA